VPVGLTFLAVGTGISLYKGYKAGKAAKAQGVAEQDAANSEADLADYNAAVATVQADDALARGAEEESRFRAGVRGMIGSQRAAFAAGNIDVAGGSALDVQADTAYLGELDALTIRNNAASEAWGYKVQSADLTKRADIARKSGVMLEKAGRTRANAAYLDTASSIVSSGGSLYTAKYGMK
jgi:hypothetical protein